MATVILGLDGAGFELLDKWLGDPLTNLQQIRNEGIAANLRPCFPPVTCPNWQCYAKARNPGKLGVFWWEKIDPQKQGVQNTSSSHDFDGDFFWDYMQSQRAILNLPTSYPPLETNGIHVSGGPGAEQTQYAESSKFEAHLSEEYNYKVHPERLSLLNKENPYNGCIQEIQDLIDTRFDVLLDLIQSEEYEFIHMSIFYINMLQHFYYDHEVVRDTWKVIDDRVGDLLECDEIENLFLMSDHGSNRVETWFRVNSWLEQNGYLVTKSGVSDLLTTVGITRERVRTVLGSLGVEWWARKIIPERIQRRLPDSEGTVDRSAKADLIDWEQSKAVASGQGPIYVLASDPNEREEICKELTDNLSGLQTPQGATVIRGVHRAEEIYNGPHVEDGPDLVLDQAPHVHIDGGIGSATIFDNPRKWNGENTMQGIFMAHGEDIGDEFGNDEIKITDLGPTILHLHNRDIPEQMDGEVLDVFASGSDAARRDPVTSGEIRPTSAINEASGVDSEVSDRLEDLGYLE